MEFRTIIKVPEANFKISHHSRLMLFGSCFAENIGNLLAENKFDVNINSYGILYNPSSVSAVIRRILQNKLFTEEDLLLHHGLYCSFLHHGSFSSPDKQETVNTINHSHVKAGEDLKNADILLVTFGTSYIYKSKMTGCVVANCHKLPASEFIRERLTVEDIIDDWVDIIDTLKNINPEVKFLFTVSPIRHWKDGAHENQLSKAILLLAIDELQKRYPDVYYFSSYEIMMDELRDYRFYEEDMIHPAEIAVKYIWEVFRKTFFNVDTLQVLKEWSSIRQAVNHRPFNAGMEQHKQFLRQTLLNIQVFQNKYPFFDCRKEKKILENQL